MAFKPVKIIRLINLLRKCWFRRKIAKNYRSGPQTYKIGEQCLNIGFVCISLSDQ